MNGMVRDFARSLDQAAFARDAGLQPDPWQIRMLETVAKRSLYLCCRQSGKSTTAANKALHTALYVPNSLTLLLSPSLRQSGEIFRKLTEQYARLDQQPDPDALSALRIEFPNGSRVVSLPGSDTTVRGYSNPALVIIDEAAHCSTELLHATLPMLASGRGALLCLSTPNGAQGWFHDAWAKDDSWEKTKITWRECPRISEREVDLYRRTAGEVMYRQEFECEFLDVDNMQIFPSALLEAAFSPEVETLWI